MPADESVSAWISERFGVGWRVTVIIKGQRKKDDQTIEVPIEGKLYYASRTELLAALRKRGLTVNGNYVRLRSDMLK